MPNVSSSNTSNELPANFPASVFLPTVTPQTIVTSNAPIVTPVSTTLFKQVLHIGSRGDEVKKLQQFLNAQGFKVAQSGAGSPGNETTVFGTATAQGVSKFQEANAEQILRPLGLIKSTGVFGTATLKLVNTLLLQ
jgi:peptidoglycan hydrolase-like protein with peptidoglycan-binding domain